MLEAPGADQVDNSGSTLREMMITGWQHTQRLQEDKGGLNRDEEHEFNKLITRTIYAPRFGSAGAGMELARGCR